jgi:hypothetical protein
METRWGIFTTGCICNLLVENSGIAGLIHGALRRAHSQRMDVASIPLTAATLDSRPESVSTDFHGLSRDFSSAKLVIRFAPRIRENNKLAAGINPAKITLDQ